MGEYRAGDAVSIPGLLSLVRVPLAAAFVWVADPVARIVILGVSGVSDLLDGWWARRFGCATATGAALDPITDKIFVTTVVVSLVVEGAMPWWSIPILAIRDIAELPLVIHFAMSRHARRRRSEHPKANLGGKLATLVQFVVVAVALFRWPYVDAWLAVAGVAGLVAAIGYWRSYLALGRATEGMGVRS